jgi:ribokinase
LSSQKPIVVVGSINTDLVSMTRMIPAIGETVLGTDFQIHPGGKGANQAVAVARLGYPVQLIGCLGTDAFGHQLRKHLEDSGVDTTGVASYDGISGVAAIVVSDKGENSIVVTPGANARVSPLDIENNIERIRGAGMVLTQLEIPIETVECLVLICKKEGIQLILDPAPAQNLPPSVLRNVDWFTPNQTEAAFYSQDQSGGDGAKATAMAEKLRAMGANNVVLKMGAEGVYLLSGNDPGVIIPAFRVQAIDTTAAGDAFNGGFATGLMLGKTSLESARFASAVAGISVTRAGAQPSMPSIDEVNELLKNSVAK